MHHFWYMYAIFYPLEGSVIKSCGVAETTIEGGSFKYFRTTFDVVTKDDVSVEVRDTIG